MFVEASCESVSSNGCLGSELSYVGSFLFVLSHDILLWIGFYVETSYVMSEYLFEDDVSSYFIETSMFISCLVLTSHLSSLFLIHIDSSYFF